MKLSQLVSSLKTGLEKIEGAGELAGQVDELLSVAAQFDDIDATEAKTAIAELGRMRPEFETAKAAMGQLTDLQTTVTTKDETISDLQRQLLAANTINTAGILPEFQDLLQPAIASAAVASEDGKYGLPDDYLGNLRQKYPSAFAAEDGAGTGGAANEGQTPESTTTTYEVGDSRTLTGLDPDAVLNGSVVLR